VSADWVLVSAITVTYLALVLAVGLRARTDTTGATLAGYVADERSLGFFVLFFIMGAEVFSAFAFLGAPGWAYARGAPALYLLGYFALALLPWWFLGIPAARVGARRGYVTQAELFGDRFGSPTLAVLVALIGVAVMVPYLTIQIVGAGFLFEAATGGNVPFWLGALLAFVVVAAYVFASGLRGIGWTNVLQGMLMVTVAWTVGLAIPERLYGGVGAMFDALAREAPEALTIPGRNQVMGWGAYSSAIVVSMLGLSMWPHLFSKAYSARSEDTIRKTVVLYPLYGLLLVPVLFVGFAGILTVPDLDQPDRILLELVERADFSPWFLGLLLSGALAAAMSTGANLAHTAASVLVRDVWVHWLDRRTAERAQVAMTRGLVLVLCAASYLLALDTPESIITLVLLAFGGLVQFFPVALAAFFGPRASREGVLAGLVGGEMVTAIFTFAVSSPFEIHAGIWGLVANVLLLVGTSLIRPPSGDGRARAFLSDAATPLAAARSVEG